MMSWSSSSCCPWTWSPPLIKSFATGGESCLTPNKWTSGIFALECRPPEVSQPRCKASHTPVAVKNPSLVFCLWLPGYKKPSWKPPDLTTQTTDLSKGCSLISWLHVGLHRKRHWAAPLLKVQSVSKHPLLKGFPLPSCQSHKSAWSIQF